MVGSWTHWLKQILQSKNKPGMLWKKLKTITNIWVLYERENVFGTVTMVENMGKHNLKLVLEKQL